MVKFELMQKAPNDEKLIKDINLVMHNRFITTPVNHRRTISPDTPLNWARECKT